MEVFVKYSRRKTISIQVRHDLSVMVRAPKYVSKKEIYEFISEKNTWINKQIERIQEFNKECNMTNYKKLTKEELDRLYDKAKEYIPTRVEHFAKLLGVEYGRITIRSQKTRWGSCSSLGNLNFNCLLMLTPPKIIDYVVVHELCHRKEMNHSKAFWNEVKSVLCDYRESVQWLKREGSIIIHQCI